MEKVANPIRKPASTGDIVGNRNGAPAHAPDPKWQKYFERMLEMRDELLARRGDLGATSPMQEGTFAVNPADRGTDEYDTGAAFGQYSSDQEVLFEIDEALRRMDNGTYGICEATGKRILEERLEAVPWTRFARDAEESVEREQQRRKARHVL
jgi:RNA polymerase-binding transcription factor DksA